MFTDYASIVYNVLSFTEAKTSSQIYTEIEELWEKAGRKGFFGRKKIPSLGGIYNALNTLEREGFAIREGGHPRSRWTKTRIGRRVKKWRLSLPSILQPATT